MAKEPALLLTVFAGGLIALQAPINSILGKSVGTFAAASVSFIVGTIALVLITALVGGGFGDVGEARHLAWYYLSGGILGAVYVTTALVAVRSLGAGGVVAATIAGQLSLSLVIDQLGILGVDKQPITWERLLGVVLLAVGTLLVIRD
ncbi:MAG TPA: DMT family transporter [Thermoleophilaceae bacterium]|nr:DMT family transporter [Thermoleophilaceae bacterium]